MTTRSSADLRFQTATRNNLQSVAITAGKSYLAAWSKGDDAARMALTSPLQFGHSPSVAEIKKLKAATR